MHEKYICTNKYVCGWIYICVCVVGLYVYIVKLHMHVSYVYIYMYIHALPLNLCIYVMVSKGAAGSCGNLQWHCGGAFSNVTTPSSIGVGLAISHDF